jgi:hypothetical protein
MYSSLVKLSSLLDEELDEELDEFAVSEVSVTY